MAEPSNAIVEFRGAPRHEDASQQPRSHAPSPYEVPHHPRPGERAPAASLKPVATLTQGNRGFLVRLRNVPEELLAKDLAEAFLAVVTHGRVESVDVLHDSMGRSIGEARFIFSSQADAHNVVQRYHGGDLNGKRLEVTFQGEVDY